MVSEKSKIYKDLKYEIKMYRWTRRELLCLLSGSSSSIPNSIAKDAIIESFAAHNRVLIGFFYPGDRIYQDDVLAKHFIEEWDTIRSPITDTLKTARTKANKQLAHLTYSRATKYDEIDKKTWLEIVNSEDLEEVIRLFEETLKEVEGNGH